MAGQGLKDSFKIFGKRFTMGGTPGKDQRVYFVNLKEIIDNKFGSATPMPYHDPIYRNIYIRYFGQYTFQHPGSDPFLCQSQRQCQRSLYEDTADGSSVMRSLSMRWIPHWPNALMQAISSAICRRNRWRSPPI